ncbi:MAG: hypothetical protein J6W54_03250 [Fibrobacter sp.]|uniref:hypothetical protein n=1 Tax=Fibrobacter sp. TaxID=35828 RepID=UPI001B1721BD|nr:hypothetical protein [Fibrobacter sp.]MBO7060099.1 hypothetical protein [Fibrobacter sp.]
MTGEEMEVAYCKSRRTCMKSFLMWLDEHAQTAEEALEMGLPEDQVLKLTIGAMKKAADMIRKDLDKGVELISEMENDGQNAR